MYVTSDAGDIHLYTAVGAALSATSAGNVGVGTTIPRTKFHVNGQSLWLTGGNGGGLPTSAGGGLRLYDDGVRGNIFAFSYATGTPRTLTLQEPGGNVGIGTTAPAERLDLGGGNIAMGYERVVESSTGSSAVATCPSGKRVIGGGCACGVNKLQDSLPADGGVQWICRCDDAGAGGTAAFAICANIR